MTSRFAIGSRWSSKFT